MLYKEVYNGYDEAFICVKDGYVRRLNAYEMKVLTEEQKASAIRLNRENKFWPTKLFDEHFGKLTTEELIRKMKDDRPEWTRFIPVRKVTLEEQKISSLYKTYFLFNN